MRAPVAYELKPTNDRLVAMLVGKQWSQPKPSNGGTRQLAGSTG